MCCGVVADGGARLYICGAEATAAVAWTRPQQDRSVSTQCVHAAGRTAVARPQPAVAPETFRGQEPKSTDIDTGACGDFAAMVAGWETQSDEEGDAMENPVATVGTATFGAGCTGWG